MSFSFFDPVDVILLFLLLLLFWTASRFLGNRTITPLVSQESTSIVDHQKLLQKSSLEERAAPNQRLVRVFGVDNAFTTTDKDYHKKFVTDARLKLPTSGNEWKIITDTVLKDIRQYLDQSENRPGPTNLVNLVQITVFRAVMLKFFPEVLALSDKDIRSITSQINSLWIASKNETYLQSNTLIADRIELFLNLRRIFGEQHNEDFDDKKSPLNILLPAYETLWRIVLRLFLEVRFRSTETEYLQYIHLFKAFLTQPDRLFDFYPPLQPCANSWDAVETAYNAQHHRVSMKDIVNEGLRLYPPTRRIYRQVGDEKIAVDVEALHRDPTSWGDDALEFRPSRFPGIKPRATSYLPFGSGNFECPAKSSFAPIFIGVIVAALTMEVGQDYQLVGKELREVVDGKELLGNGRNALGDLGIDQNVTG
jgi:hypothetical protein